MGIKTKTSFGKDNQPRKRRGKSKQTLILDAIKERGLLDLPEDATKDDAEKAVFGFLAEAAFNPSQDTAVISNTSLNHLMKKGWPDVKPVMPAIEFELDPNGTPKQKAEQILNAVADGVMPADVANSLISSIASLMKIEEVTELKERLDKIEEALGING